MIEQKVDHRDEQVPNLGAIRACGIDECRGRELRVAHTLGFGVWDVGCGPTVRLFPSIPADSCTILRSSPDALHITASP